jgi:transcription elongation GreA/GreB family factor
MSPRKAALKTELSALLRRDLAAAESAHRATVAGATHEEARPENDKDTRALEQSYLARGQAQRVEDLRAAIAEVEALALSGDARTNRVALGALVRVKEEHEERERTLTYWVAPQGGGASLEGGKVQVVTPRSPLGKALVGRTAGDECEVVIAGKARHLEVLGVDEDG